MHLELRGLPGCIFFIDIYIYIRHLYTQSVKQSFVLSSVTVDIQVVEPKRGCDDMSSSSKTLISKIVRRYRTSFSVLDLEDAPLLQVVHLLEDERHVVAELVEFRHRHLLGGKKKYINNFIPKTINTTRTFFTVFWSNCTILLYRVTDRLIFCNYCIATCNCCMIYFYFCNALATL